MSARALPPLAGGPAVADRLLAAALARIGAFTQNRQADRLAVAAFFAIVAHAVFILGVSFSPEERPVSPVETLDVTIVTHKTDAAPDSARHLAQANQDGGANLPRGREPATTPTRTPLLAASPREAEPLPVEEVPAIETATNAAPAPAREVRPKPAARRNNSDKSPNKAPAATARILAVRAPATKSAPPTPARATRANKPVEVAAPAPDAGAPDMSAATLMRRSLAMASLSASVDDKLRAYSQRPREKFITSRTREHAFAAYMESWRQKVERVGNLNYPDAARRNRMSGRLQLDVAILPDGNVKSIEIRRASRHAVLDDAAVRIVKLAAPYARFPAAIAADVDVLHIVRTWVFSASNQFASGR